MHTEQRPGATIVLTGVFVVLTKGYRDMKKTAA